MGMLFLFEETFPRNLRDSLIHSRPPKHVQKGNIHYIILCHTIHTILVPYNKEREGS
jgi:hypothetical protein